MTFKLDSVNYAQLDKLDQQVIVEMNKLIDAGMDYADAQFRVARQFGIHYGRVQMLYDAQFE